MNNQSLIKLNSMINNAYECLTFFEFLKLTILKLHELVMYDSGMFFCAISKDCSYFKPFLGEGSIENYYKKKTFLDRDAYLSRSENANEGNEPLVFKGSDYLHGFMQSIEEPRSSFLISQDILHIVCIRIVHKGRFMGEIYLHRSKDRLDFDDEDLFTLRLLQPHVSTVFSIIHTLTAVNYLESNNQSNGKKGICMLDHELGLIGGNVTGLEMMKIPTLFGSSVLYHIKEICMDLMAEEKKLNKEKVTLQTAILGLPQNDLHLDVMVKWKNEANRKTTFVIIMEYVNQEKVAADYKFKFSKREAEIIDWLIQGKNNIQLAKNMSLSENTIKTHIKNIYKKTGTSNRTELTYVLLLNR